MPFDDTTTPAKKRKRTMFDSPGDFVRGLIDHALQKWGMSKSQARSGYKNANVQLEALDRDKASR